jgi:hypothetical protein
MPSGRGFRNEYMLTMVIVYYRRVAAVVRNAADLDATCNVLMMQNEGSLEGTRRACARTIGGAGISGEHT